MGNNILNESLKYSPIKENNNCQNYLTGAFNKKEIPIIELYRLDEDEEKQEKDFKGLYKVNEKHAKSCFSSNGSAHITCKNFIMPTNIKSKYKLIEDKLGYSSNRIKDEFDKKIEVVVLSDKAPIANEDRSFILNQSLINNTTEEKKSNDFNILRKDYNNKEKLNAFGLGKLLVPIREKDNNDVSKSFIKETNDIKNNKLNLIMDSMNNKSESYNKMVCFLKQNQKMENSKEKNSNKQEYSNSQYLKIEIPDNDIDDEDNSFGKKEEIMTFKKCDQEETEDDPFKLSNNNEKISNTKFNWKSNNNSPIKLNKLNLINRTNFLGSAKKNPNESFKNNNSSFFNNNDVADDPLNNTMNDILLKNNSSIINDEFGARSFKKPQTSKFKKGKTVLFFPEINLVSNIEKVVDENKASKIKDEVKEQQNSSRSNIKSNQPSVNIEKNSISNTKNYSTISFKDNKNNSPKLKLIKDKQINRLNSPSKLQKYNVKKIDQQTFNLLKINPINDDHDDRIDFVKLNTESLTLLKDLNKKNNEENKIKKPEFEDPIQFVTTQNITSKKNLSYKNILNDTTLSSIYSKDKSKTPKNLLDNESKFNFNTINIEENTENTIICDSNLKNISNPSFLEINNNIEIKNSMDTKIQLLKYLEYNTSRDEILNNKKLHVLYKNKSKISSNFDKSSKIKTNMNQLLNENISLNLFKNENQDPYSLKSLNACKNKLKTHSIKDLDKEDFRIYSNFNKNLKKPIQNISGISSIKSLNKTIKNYSSIYDKNDEEIIFSINKIPVKTNMIKNFNL